MMGGMGKGKEDKFRLEINGQVFEPIPGVRYLKNYRWVAEKIVSKEYTEFDLYRTLVLDDLWFVVYFVLGWKGANHPFVIQACREVQEGPKDYTLDLWGREHGKSTIITVAETIQDILNDPEGTNCIFSYSRTKALDFLRSVKWALEKSSFLKELFPDILYDNPEREADKWAEEAGLVVKRKSNKTAGTLEAWGLVEGMPTGKHFDRRKYDDIVTFDNAGSLNQTEKVVDAFMMSHNLGTDGGTHRVVGTPYHYADAIAFLRNLKKDGNPVYFHRLKPSLLGGEPNGEPVFLSKERIEQLRIDEQKFYSQHLLDPTPKANRKLDPDMLKELRVHEIPKRLYKFIVVDSAGSNKIQKRGDSWAIWCVGVEPVMDDVGASNLYILDGVIEKMEEVEAYRQIVEMYKRNGRIEKVGVEKVAMTSTEVHVANALRAAGKRVSVETGTLELLRPSGRSKEERIVSNLQWPLHNGKIHISSAISWGVKERLRMEMDKFPFAPHDDGLDALSYVIDMIKDYRFPKRWIDVPDGAREWMDDYGESGRSSGSRSWMVC
jgi:hypothetical protein